MVSPGPGVETVPGRGKHVETAEARPIMGGTLYVAKDGKTAIAGDPDRAALFVVDLEQRAVERLDLEKNAVPGRIAEDDRGQAYVVLRNAGQVAKLDLTTRSITQRLEVCASPRGIAYEAATQRIHVACSGGSLLSFGAQSGELERQIYVADDLRDVVASGDSLVLTRFRSAEVIVVDESGQISQRLSTGGSTNLLRANTSTASVAWRATGTSTGEVLISHQLADTEASVSTEESGYGSSNNDCGASIVTPAVSKVSFDEAGQATLTTELVVLGSAGPTDLAASRTGGSTLLVSGNAWNPGTPTLMHTTAADPEFPVACPIETGTTLGDGEPVAAAYDGHGQLVVQSREPAALYLADGSMITLSTESRASTGLALFHMNTGSGIACASCHPEGMDDAQTWHFEGIGPRRTQTVAGGIKQRAPFHWDGDMEDFTMLVNEVMVGRMSLPVRPNPKQLDAFGTWIDGIERPAARMGDADALERGRAIFHDSGVGCADCHNGPALTNNLRVDVGTGGEFVVPTLIGIASRAPYLHDGCAATLRDRFSDCGGGDQHGRTSHLNEAELADLVVYLESL